MDNWKIVNIPIKHGHQSCGQNRNTVFVIRKASLLTDFIHSVSLAPSPLSFDSRYELVSPFSQSY